MILRVVIDTNIYVSALRYGGKPKQVLSPSLFFAWLLARRNRAVGSGEL
jgi:hypothetical protein